MPLKSSTDNLTRFDGIFLKGIAPPVCSRLYCLEPIGVGTPMVESLTSYVGRLASAHCVKMSTLITKEIAPLIDKDYLTDKSSLSLSTQFMYVGRRINGIGVTAEDWVNALQVLTLRKELRFLTMLPWKDLIPDRELLRKTRAWCPGCYEEWNRKEKPIYDPLLWSLKTVIACPNHEILLREKCVQCKSLYLALSRISLPGFCSHCNLWLGDSSSNVSAEDAVLTKEQLDWQRYLARQLGEVFTVVYQGASLQKELAARLVSTCVQRSTRGDVRAFIHRFNSFNYSTIGSWLSGTVSPELGSLVEMCYRTSVSLKDVLCGGHSTDIISPGFASIRLKNSCPLTPDIMIGIEAALHPMLEEEPPPSGNEVSKRIGRNIITLRKYFPELLSLIEERFCNYKAELYDKEKIKSSLMAAKEENPPRSVNSVAKSLGCSKSLLRQHFPEDCKIISKRYFESWTVFVDIDDTRAKLVSLKAETPPLSIIQCAERLGCSRWQLNRYFPDITRAIGIRYYKYCQKQSKLRREQRYKTILETAAALKVEQITPNSYQIRKRLPNMKGLYNREVEAVLRGMNTPKRIN